MNNEVLEQARQNVADRYPHTYTKNAILGGFWDGGNIVRGEYERLMKKRAAA